MGIITNLIKHLSTQRLREIENFRTNPIEVQDSQFRTLIEGAERCSYGEHYGVTSKDSYREFSQKFPIVTYEDLAPWVDRMREGESDVLWKDKVHWFAKSSGTTQDKSKYLPLTSSSLKECHQKGAKDVVHIALDSHPDLDIFEGKVLTLGGSHTIDNKQQSDIHAGDLSAILIETTPSLFSIKRSPRKEIALTADFYRKVELICESCSKEDIRAFAGVPSWNLILLKSILEYTGKSQICDVWPNMQLFMHGGVKFDPYRESFNQIIGGDRMKYIETYNASEGFFGIEDESGKGDMLLMLDYEVFYEFIPMSNFGDWSRVIPLEDVKVGVNYAMIITTSGGLWRYLIGDTVSFTSTHPYRIKITGRTKQYINAFGEELIVDNSDSAIKRAAEATSAQVIEYSAAPIYMSENSKGSHQWIIEFEREPDDFDLFCKILDQTLQELNSDYGAKRENNFTLLPPSIIKAPKGLFTRWMESRGKVGGQNKIPRLSNNREYIDSLLKLF